MTKADMQLVHHVAHSMRAPLTLQGEIMQRIEAAFAGVEKIRVMATRNAEIMGLAKAEFLRVLTDSTRLATPDLTRRDARRVLRTHPPFDHATIEPADGKAFGRRIDFDGLAHRYVSGSEL